ncbi:MAG: hypothetical protein P1U86_13405 [Verrucomicrobiales bacterium]|nr:hypothetical protein [Verrucomicrobiales bacterium]
MRLTNSNRSRERGSALVDIALSFAALVTVSLLSLKASTVTTSSLSWTVKQAMTDAYITRETAMSSRIPFELAVSNSSPWPTYPSIATTQVVVGKLPGAKDVTATLHRTRFPDANNLNSAGGTGTATSNPSSSEAWKLESLLVYNIGPRQYVKSRTTLRVR